MSYFLVDFENTHSGGLNNFNKLTENDTVEIFYSDSVNSMTFDLHTRILTCPAKFIYTKITNGTKNALDFILLTQLACKISENADKNYFIISKDKGFDVICDWWREKKMRVARIEEISRFEYALNRLDGVKPAAEQPAAEQSADEPAEDPAEPAEETPAEETPTEETAAESAAGEEVSASDDTAAEDPAETAPSEEVVVKADKGPESVSADEAASEPEKQPAEVKPATEEIKPETPPKQPNRRQTKKPAGRNAARNKKQPTDKQPTEDKKQPENKKQSEKNARAEITAQLTAAEITDAAEVADTVILYIEKYKTKQGIHNALVKKYPSKDNEKAAGIYKAIKGFITDKK